MSKVVLDDRARRLAGLPREVALAGADEDAAMAARVIHRDAAGAHARQRAVAAVLDVPAGAAHAGDAVAPARAELPVVVASP